MQGTENKKIQAHSAREADSSGGNQGGDRRPRGQSRNPVPEKEPHRLPLNSLSPCCLFSQVQAAGAEPCSVFGFSTVAKA